MRPMSCVLCCALLAPFALADDPKPAPKAEAKWTTVKGTVVFPADKAIPKQPVIAVPANQAACLKGAQLLDETIAVHPKNRGIKNVVVWLRPNNANNPKAAFAANEIHPADAKRKPAQVVIDQPCLLFQDRVTVARVGDTLVVKNSDAIQHNFFWVSENNGNFNVNIQGGGKHVFANPLGAESPPIQYKCTVHPWMTGYVRIFDHPYFAVTDADGKFEIKNAPVGKFRIVYWHENGLRGGRNGRFGDVVDIAGETMEMKPVDFDVTAK
jgi:plastocyanin